MAKSDEPKATGDQLGAMPPKAAPDPGDAQVTAAPPAVVNGPDGPVAPITMWSVADGTRTDIIEARSADAAKYVFMAKYNICDSTQSWDIKAAA